MVNGVILIAAERLRRRGDPRWRAARRRPDPSQGRALTTLSYKEAGGIGLAQSTALIAGISRDGICMTTGLLRGLNNEDAARFAFLLATPIILAAGIFKLSALTGPLGAGIRGQAVVAAVCAALAAIAAVHWLLLLPQQQPDPIRNLLPGVWIRDGDLHHHVAILRACPELN
jgi:undecaprenyl-diphosphatase